MKKIVIISSYCFDKPSANGLCSNAIADALQERGYDVYKIGMVQDAATVSELKDNEYAIQYTPPKVLERKGISRKWHSAISILKQCLTSGQDKKKRKAYYRLLKELDSRYRFDGIVSFCFPPEAVSAATKFKKNHPRIRHIIYELDSLTDGINHYSSSWYGKYIYAAKVRFSRRQYPYADQICAMKCHEAHIEQLYYKTFRDTFRMVDLPLLRDNTQTTKAPTDTVRFLYTGEVSLTYRHPQKLIQLLELTRQQMNWSVDMFCKGSGEPVLKRYAQTDKRLTVHGYVDAAVLSQWYTEADVLVNIGNAVSNSLPSKLIHYLTYGKPIVHICLQKNDVCASYMERYPLSLVIEADEPIESAAARLTAFVGAAVGKRVAYSEIQEQYRQNTPQYSVNVMEELLLND